MYRKKNEGIRSLACANFWDHTKYNSNIGKYSTKIVAHDSAFSRLLREAAIQRWLDKTFPGVYGPLGFGKGYFGTSLTLHDLRNKQLDFKLKWSGQYLSQHISTNITTIIGKAKIIGQKIT